MALTKQLKYKDSSGNEQLIDIGVDAKNVESNTFSQATARANLVSGEKLPTIFGKLMKWFADLKTVAWTGSYNDLTNKPTMGGITGTVAVTQGGTGATTASQARVNLGVGAAGTYNVANNCTTTAAGYALDARQGKALMDKANQISSDLVNVNSNLGGLKFGIDASGNYGYYKAGADSVTPFRKQPLIFTTSPADIKSVLPDIYTNLTADDFLICATGTDISLGISKTMTAANYYDSIKCSKAYDPVTGKLTFSGFSRKSNIPNGWWNTVATGVIAIYMG